MMPNTKIIFPLNKRAYSWFLWSTVLSLSIILVVGGRLLSAVFAALNHTENYYLSDKLAFWLLTVYGLCMVGLVIWPKLLRNDNLTLTNVNISIYGCILAILGAFCSDLFYLVAIAIIKNDYLYFAYTLPVYLKHEAWVYLFLLFLLASFCIGHIFFYKKINEDRISVWNHKYFLIVFLLLATLLILSVINIGLFKKLQATRFIELPLFYTFFTNLFCAVSMTGIILSTYFFHKKYSLPIKWLKQWTYALGIGLGFILCSQVFLAIFPYSLLAKYRPLSVWQIIEMGVANIAHNAIKFLPFLVLTIVVIAMKKIIKAKQFDESTKTDQTSGNYGTAAWANKKELEKKGMYNRSNGLLIGVDNNGDSLYVPICNKLTISPPGGGKTTSSSIPVLLEHDGPVFAFDIKGELWAVTARYRAEILKRNVVTIDPFGIIKTEDFKKGKPDNLLKEYHLNPFDWIPEDKRQRDRMINAFAASFVINEGGFATHFDENAKILIRGYIDYMMTQDISLRTMPMLYQLISEDIEQANITFQQMAQLDGRAGAAANQIFRVGADERGSILSTSYRQLDWIGDSNISNILSNSNFDLRDFLKGNIDIYVVLPEDQVKDHNRLVRMLMALLMGMLVQASPSQLPKKKMLFLLEELAQLGYCPDVEQCIEVLRARGVVVWTVFQTLSQIEMFEKPDLFKGAPLKQIFTTDDTKTMEWIQTLGGKKTVLSKTLSTNTGDSRKEMQAFGGTKSKGEGESIQETGVDFIHLNEIREMSKDEQFIFLHGAKPIRCKKGRYYEHANFAGNYDENPLEKVII